MIRRLFLSLALLLSVHALQAQVTVQDPSSSTIDEYAAGTGIIGYYTPATGNPALIGSDLRYSWDHDARWAAATTTHVSGANSRIASLFSKGNSFFVKTGDTFSKILQAYQEIYKFVELYKQMEAAWKFKDQYKLTVNLYRFMPLMDVMAPDEMGGGQAFAIGVLPKDSDGWEARANILKDNPWYRPKGGLRLVEVRYPHSLNDLTLDSSVWGSDNLDEEELTKRELAGMYDGVVSASVWLNQAGVRNNLMENASAMGPRAMALRKSQIVARRILSLQTRKDLLDKMSKGIIDIAPGMTPAEVLDQMAAIDAEIARLQEEDTKGYATAVANQEVWMRQASFVTEILAKLEKRERRLALMKLNERYKKYEAFWATSGQMDPTPEITGNPQVDNAIYVIWQALTVLSNGKIPPPTPVPGGPAAEAQSTMVRSQYAEHLVDELRAIRRLLAFRYQNDIQQLAVEKTVADGRAQVDAMEIQLQARAQRIKQLNAYAAARQEILANGDGWAFGSATQY